MNEEYPPDEYRDILTLAFDGSHTTALRTKTAARSFFAKQPHYYRHEHTVEGCSGGDYLFDSKHCFGSFGMTAVQDARYSYNSRRSHEMIDTEDAVTANRIIDSIHLDNPWNVGFSWNITMSSNIYYSSDMSACHYCFLCTGLSDMEYCILNKQYTKEAYNKLIPKIIAHMRETGEW